MDIKKTSGIYFIAEDFDKWKALDHPISKETQTIKYLSRFEKKWIELAKNKGLHDFICSVNVALIDGELYKITGIIREKLWEEGLINKPNTLNLYVYSLDEESYTQLINTLYPISLKNKSQNLVLSCYQDLGLSFKSTRIQHGYISEAINIALRGEPRALQDKRSLKQEVNLYKAINTFKNELTLIDNINPNIKIFTTGILAASLISLSINPKVIDFFIKLNRFDGETKVDRSDSIETLLRSIETLKRKSVSEGKIQVELCSKTIRAIQIWGIGKEQDQYWIKRLASIDFLPDIRKLKKIKGIHGIKDM